MRKSAFFLIRELGTLGREIERKVVREAIRWVGLSEREEVERRRSSEEQVAPK